MESRAEVQSFDFRTLQLVEEQFPKIPTYYLTGAPASLSSNFVPAALRHHPQLRPLDPGMDLDALSPRVSRSQAQRPILHPERKRSHHCVAAPTNSETTGPKDIHTSPLPSIASP